MKSFTECQICHQIKEGCHEGVFTSCGDTEPIQCHCHFIQTYFCRECYSKEMENIEKYNYFRGRREALKEVQVNLEGEDEYTEDVKILIENLLFDAKKKLEEYKQKKEANRIRIF